MTPPTQAATRPAAAAAAACRMRGQFNRASRHRPIRAERLTLSHAGPAPNGQARRSTTQLRRPSFPITRADSGIQVTRTPRPARPRASPRHSSRWLAQRGGKVVPRRPEIGWFTEPHASAAGALPVRLARVPPRSIAVQAQPAPDVGTHGSYCPPALMARQDGSCRGWCRPSGRFPLTTTGSSRSLRSAKEQTQFIIATKR